MPVKYILESAFEREQRTQKRPVNDLQAAFQIQITSLHQIKLASVFAAITPRPTWRLCPPLPMSPQTLLAIF